MIEGNDGNSLSSPDIEMAVIGSIFVNESSAYHALNQLTARDFSGEIYREIFEVIKDQYEEDLDVDKSLITSHFKTHKEESYKYVNSIQKCIQFCNPKKIDKYCEELQGLTFRRDLHSAAEKLSMKSLDPTVPKEELYKEIDKAKEVEFRTNPDVARTSAQIKKDAEEQEQQPQLITGLKEWDGWFYKEGGRGLGTTELIFARPGHGKTYYLFRKEGQLALNGQLGLHFHLEDTDMEASNRIDAVVPPEIEENDNILVIDQHRYLHDILQDIRYYKHKYGIKWVSVDHMGRVKVSGYSAKDKTPAMIEVSNALTDHCENLDLHGMFTVQPNKSYKQRSGWDNLLREEDLKGATEIFEDAFVVTTLMRPNIYPELRGGMAEQKYVKKKDGTEAHYDSVFLSQIKNRRQRLTDDFLHMIQVESKLLTEREYRNLDKDNSNDNHKLQEDPPLTDDDFPF